MGMKTVDSKEMFRMQGISALELLEAQFPMVQRVIVGNVINVGYQHLFSFTHDPATPNFLKLGRASKLKPEMKNMAVEYAFMQACNKGLIPLKWTLESTGNSSIKYLKLVTSDNSCVFTINQTASAGRRSRHAKFRDQLDDTFESSFNLFPEGSDTRTIITEPDSAYYCEINHGYQSDSPTFAVVGKPAKNHGWHGQLSLLNQIQLLSKGEANDARTGIRDLEKFGKDDFAEFIIEHSKDD
ncbi:hypothetical protein PSR33_09610 (plasmid) [Latilactobacillus curvatus]|uniref:Uncharacterized protein n=1 Tax=Latilactobacillus curvatus TaxID=28038 RepID=A0AAJ5RFX0_LATCU|nr:hypothetical protein [Latilactobacillus curvatus]WDC92806.1 hypothetical protein PSR33_09610 [Latilactobacillus curvatus]